MKVRDMRYEEFWSMFFADPYYLLRNSLLEAVHDVGFRVSAIRCKMPGGLAYCVNSGDAGARYPRPQVLNPKP
jgi:hypothetical protein